MNACGIYNRGTPKSSILAGFSLMNHPFWSTSIYGNLQLVSQTLVVGAKPRVSRESVLSACKNHSQGLIIHSRLVYKLLYVIVICLCSNVACLGQPKIVAFNPGFFFFVVFSFFFFFFFFFFFLLGILVQ